MSKLSSEIKFQILIIISKIRCVNLAIPLRNLNSSWNKYKCTQTDVNLDSSTQFRFLTYLIYKRCFVLVHTFTTPFKYPLFYLLKLTKLSFAIFLIYYVLMFPHPSNYHTLKYNTILGLVLSYKIISCVLLLFFFVSYYFVFVLLTFIHIR